MIPAMVFQPRAIETTESTDSISSASARFDADRSDLARRDSDCDDGKLRVGGSRNELCYARPDAMEHNPNRFHRQRSAGNYRTQRTPKNRTTDSNHRHIHNSNGDDDLLSLRHLPLQQPELHTQPQPDSSFRFSLFRVKKKPPKWTTWSISDQRAKNAESSLTVTG